VLDGIVSNLGRESRTWSILMPFLSINLMEASQDIRAEEVSAMSIDQA